MERQCECGTAFLTAFAVVMRDTDTDGHARHKIITGTDESFYTIASVESLELISQVCLIAQSKVCSSFSAGRALHAPVHWRAQSTARLQPIWRAHTCTCVRLASSCRVSMSSVALPFRHLNAPP